MEPPPPNENPPEAVVVAVVAVVVGLAPKLPKVEPVDVAPNENGLLVAAAVAVGAVVAEGPNENVDVAAGCVAPPRGLVVAPVELSPPNKPVPGVAEPVLADPNSPPVVAAGCCC